MPRTSSYSKRQRGTTAAAAAAATAAIALASSVLLLCASVTTSFMVLPKRAMHHSSFMVQQRRYSLSFTVFGTTKRNSFMDRLDGESDDAFFRRITAAASDPALFERTVLQNDNKQTVSTPSDSSSTAAATTSTSFTAANKTGTYVRAEDWDAEEQRRQKSGELTWEERVQFEGQRYGNRLQQNDILRQNLHK